LLTVFIAIFFGCDGDTQTAQPDFTVNKMVAEIRSNAGAIVTQYTYDDIIEACVSSDENGNFFKTISLQTLEQLPLLQ
jgi:hypothetical protein